MLTKILRLTMSFLSFKLWNLGQSIHRCPFLMGAAPSLFFAAPLFFKALFAEQGTVRIV